MSCEIETVEDWNAAMGWVWNPYTQSWDKEGCCCPMPMCPVPTIHCEYKQGEATCEDSADVETYGPGGYGYQQGCFLPFVETHDPLDALLVGNLYRFLSGVTVYPDTSTGTGGSKFAWNDWAYCGPPAGTIVQESGSDTATFTWTNGAWDDPAVSRSAVHYSLGEYPCTDPAESCGSDTSGIGPPPEVGVNAIVPLQDQWEIVTPAYWDCTETTRTLVGAERAEYSGTPQSADACPGPWGQPAGEAYLEWYWWDLTGQDGNRVSELFDPIDRAGLIAEAEAAMPELWSVIGECEDPYSSTEIIWPSNPVPYPDCEDDLTLQEASVLKVVHRFKWKIPDTFCGRYFKVTYDLVFYPEGTADAEVIAQDEVDEWEGPGDPEDPETWMFPSDYVTLAVPKDAYGVERNGVMRVRNIRFECYHGARFGVRPQTMGEAYEPPAP